MKAFARATRLPNIGGRGDYIVNPEKQENVVAASEKVDWSEYQKYEREHQKTTTKNNEGREMIIMLPNEWADLPNEELHQKAERLVRIVTKGHEAQWAMHWNKAKSNFHIHIIHSERKRNPNPERWDRDIYLTKDGKVARRKADRARNEDGSFKPPVHRKGDLKDGFTAKDPDFAKQSWLYKTKLKIQDEMEAMGVEFDRPGILHEYHEGKGSEAPAIRAKNELIRTTNREVENIMPSLGVLAYNPKTMNGIKNLALEALNKGEVLHIYTVERNGNEVLNYRSLPMEEYNAKKEVIAENNRRYSLISESMPDTDCTPIANKLKDMMKDGSIPVLHLNPDGIFQFTRFTTPSKAKALMQNTMVQFPKAQEAAAEVPTRSDPEQQTSKQPEVPSAELAGITQGRAAAPEKVSSASADLPPKEPPSFTALIAADKNFRMNQAAVSKAKSDLGMERPVNRELIALPDKLREAAKKLSDAYWSIKNAQEQMSHLYAPVPPGFLAGKKKKREYETDLAEYNAKMTPLKASVSEAKKSMQENLDIILPHMDYEDRQRQGYGREAPIMTAENVSFGDINHLERRIDFLLYHGRGFAAAIGGENRYSHQLDTLNAARDALNASQERLDARWAEIPPEYHEAAQRAIDDAREAESTLIQQQTQEQSRPRSTRSGRDR